jgi:hypothetical protein
VSLGEDAEFVPTLSEKIFESTAMVINALTATFQPTLIFVFFQSA